MVKRIKKKNDIMIGMTNLIKTYILEWLSLNLNENASVFGWLFQYSVQIRCDIWHMAFWVTFTFFQKLYIISSSLLLSNNQWSMQTNVHYAHVRTWRCINCLCLKVTSSGDNLFKCVSIKPSNIYPCCYNCGFIRLP